MDAKKTKVTPLNKYRDTQLSGLLLSVKNKFVANLCSRVDTLFERADDVLFEMSERAGTNPEREIYFDTMRVVRKERVAIKDIFSKHLERSFYLGGANGGGREAAGASFSENGKRVSALSDDVDTGDVDKNNEVSVEDLRLVPSEKIEEDIAVSSMAKKGDSFYRDYLAEINGIIEQVNKKPGDNIAADGLSPATICSAIEHSLSGHFLAVEVRILIYKLFDQFVIAKLNPIYADVIAAFNEAGYSYKIKHTYSRPRSSGSVSGRGQNYNPGQGGSSHGQRDGTSNNANNNVSDYTNNGVNHDGAATEPEAEDYAGFVRQPSGLAPDPMGDSTSWSPASDYSWANNIFAPGIQPTDGAGAGSGFKGDLATLATFAPGLGAWMRGGASRPQPGGYDNIDIYPLRHPLSNAHSKVTQNIDDAVTLPVRQVFRLIDAASRGVGVLGPGLSAEQLQAALTAWVKSMSGAKTETEFSLDMTSFINVKRKLLLKVDRMFTWLAREAVLSDRGRDLVSQVRAAALKSALVDNTFFDDVDHPMRQLVNDLVVMGLPDPVSAGAETGREEGQSKDLVEVRSNEDSLGKAQILTESLSRDFEEKPAVIDDVANKLGKLQHEQKKQDSVETRTQRIKRRTILQVRQQVMGKNAPPECVPFFLKVLAPMIARRDTLYGPRSKQYVSALRDMQIVVSALQPVDDAGDEDINLRYTDIDSLADRCLSEIGVNKTEGRAIVNKLRSAISMSLLLEPDEIINALVFTCSDRDATPHA